MSKRGLQNELDGLRAMLNEMNRVGDQSEMRDRVTERMIELMRMKRAAK